jgi:hypothetical protein
MNIFKSNFRLALLGILAVTCLVGVSVEGAETVKSADGMYDYTGVDVNSLMVQQAVDEVWQKLEQEKKKGKLEMRAIKFASFRNKINYYAQYPDIEKETKVAKTWFTKMTALLNDMYRSRKLMEIAILKKDKAEFTAAKAKYVEQLEQFQKLKENPARLDGNRR